MLSMETRPSVGTFLITIKIAKVKTHLGLALLGQNAGDDVVKLANELEHRVRGQVLERKLPLASVARVRLAQNRVAIAGHDLARLEKLPEVGLDVLVRGVGADFVAHPQDEAEHLLVRETVQRAGETVHRGRER